MIIDFLADNFLEIRFLREGGVSDESLLELVSKGRELTVACARICAISRGMSAEEAHRVFY